MEVALQFQHRWWHRAGVWLTVVLSALLAGVCTYAALFEPPLRQGQWIPLLAILVAAWATFVHYVRIRHVPLTSFAASAAGVKVIGPAEGQSQFVLWTQVVEVQKGSSLTGCGFIRCTTPPLRVRFCNWFGEADALAEFSIQRCREVHGA